MENLSDTSASGSLDERKLQYEAAARIRELDLREREVAAKESEADSKEKELERSRWLNPTVIGIFVAAIGLLSSVVVARLNKQHYTGPGAAASSVDHHPYGYPDGNGKTRISSFVGICYSLQILDSLTIRDGQSISNAHRYPRESHHFRRLVRWRVLRGRHNSRLRSRRL